MRTRLLLVWSSALAVFLPLAARAVGTLYETTILADNPVGYWRLSDTSGSVATASAGSNGTISGGVSLGVSGAIPSDGIYNLASGLNGSDAYVSTSATLAPSFSVELWMKSSTATWNDYWGEASRQPNGFMFYGHQGGTSFQFDVFGAFGGYSGLGYAPTGDITEWHYYAATYDNSTLTAALYYDGQLVNTKPNIIPDGRTTDTLFMEWGGDSLYGRYGSGAIDEIAVYNGVLSPAAIQSHYLAAPEPSRAILLLSGIILAFGHRRRRCAK